MSSKPISKRIWREETADSNRLFAEADRLNEIAYGLLIDGPTNDDAVGSFQAAKDAADAKYEEARRAWEKTKVHLKTD